MKNVLLIFTALLCAYLYVHPRVEPAPGLIPVAAVPVAAEVPVATPDPLPEPTPTPEPKLYYHSALDAPSATSGYTTSGYFSADPPETTGQHLSGSTYGSAPGYSPYDYPYSTGTVYNTLVINRSAAPAPVRPTPPASVYSGRPRLVSPTGISHASASRPAVLPRT